MLEVRDLSAAYGKHPALQNVSLTVGKGEIVVILGANGAGKSTLLRAIAGICQGAVEGHRTFAGRDLCDLTADEIVAHGIALVPEGRGIFGELTVRENLVLGAYSNRARTHEDANLSRVHDLFPKLKERANQVAATMSGGEQQMVAIGRAMMSHPDILMLDEPSLGLSPLLCRELFQNLVRIREAGIGILLVEQNARQSLAIADRGYLLENTRLVHEDTAERLARDPAVQKAYLGTGGEPRAGMPQAEGPAPNRPVPPVIPSVHRPPRQSADQLLGTSIEDMVAAATARSARPPAPASARAARRTGRTDTMRVCGPWSGTSNRPPRDRDRHGPRQHPADRHRPFAWTGTVQRPPRPGKSRSS